MTPASPAAGSVRLLRRLDLHARLRWAGVALFALAVPADAVHLTHIALGLAPKLQLFLCVGSLLAPLSAFGTNNDTAVNAMRELERTHALPDRFRDELKTEHERRPKQLADGHASVKASFILPLVAACVVSLLYYRAGAFG